MLAKSSADPTPAIRSAAAHERLIAALSARHPPLAAEGFEHHLFRTGDSVLKVYRWFRSGALSLDAELVLRDEQRSLHEVYAPRLETRVVALDAGGERCARGSARACCYALTMRLADELPAEVWRERNSAVLWSERAGAALAACHRRAPRVAFACSDRAAALEELLVDAAHLYDVERRR
jgi:hypothetical protein